MMRGIGVIAVCAALSLAAPSATGQTADEAARLERRDQIQQCRALLKQSLELAETADYDSALARLAEARKCDSTNPDVLFHIGRLKLHLGDTAAAAEVLREGVTRAPLSTRLRLLLARVEIAGGAPDEAAESVDAVLAVKPREGEALYLKGLIALGRGDTAQAVEFWGQALDIALAGKTP